MFNACFGVAWRELCVDKLPPIQADLKLHEFLLHPFWVISHNFNVTFVTGFHRFSPIGSQHSITFQPMPATPQLSGSLARFAASCVRHWIRCTLREAQNHTKPKKDVVVSFLCWSCR
jgi:hypothetical protein